MSDLWLPALFGFGVAFAIQAFARHWQIWVDFRKSLVSDVIASIDDVRKEAGNYYAQDIIAKGRSTREAISVIYKEKMSVNHFAVLSNEFGPVSPACDRTFREFRELVTGRGFGIKGKADNGRIADIDLAAAECQLQLWQWSCQQLTMHIAFANWWRRFWIWSGC